MIQPGNVLKTVSSGRNIYAEAKIAEEFDVAVPIWDLNKFLGSVSMFNNPDLEFHDTHVVITNGRSSITYYYSEPSLLTVPTKELKMPKTKVSFDLDEQDLNEILKASSILQVTDLKMIGNDGKFRIMVDDATQSTANNFEIVLDENYTGDDFDGTINVSEIKFIPGSYSVELTDSITPPSSSTRLWIYPTSSQSSEDKVTDINNLLWVESIVPRRYPIAFFRLILPRY
jgi:hypothetical protein